MTKNDVAEIFILSAEKKAHQTDKQANALLKLAMMARADVNTGRVASKIDVLKRLRSTRG